MPDDGPVPAKTPGAQPASHEASARHDRPSLIGFLTDTRSEEALRDGLADVTPGQLDLRRGGVRAAVAAMQKQATPKVLVVDVSGESQPLTALGDLAHVVEPDVCVLVVGETNHIDFYREITRGMGAADYLAKPLTRDEAHRWVMEGQVELFNDVFGEPPEAGEEAAPGATLYVRVPASLKDQIEAAAAGDKLSVNAWAIRCMEGCVASRLTDVSEAGQTRRLSRAARLLESLGYTKLPDGSYKAPDRPAAT